jgi:hypothetical protein
MSREVTIPRSFEYILPDSVMGIPQNPYLALMASTSETVLVGLRQIGSTMKPFSYFCGEQSGSAFWKRGSERCPTDLDTPNHPSLFLDGAIVVDNSDSAHEL